MSTGQNLETTTREQNARTAQRYAAAEQPERPAVLYTSSVVFIVSAIAFLKNLAFGKRPQPQLEDETIEKLGSGSITDESDPPIERDDAIDYTGDAGSAREGAQFPSSVMFLNERGSGSFFPPQQHQSHGSGQLLNLPGPGIQIPPPQTPSIQAPVSAPVANDNPTPEETVAPPSGGTNEGDGSDAGDGDVTDDPNVRNRNRQPIVSGAVVFDDLLVNAAIIISMSDLLRHASDPDGDTLAITNLTASSGQLADNGDGTYRFLPTAGDLSDVTFSYLVSDGQATTPQTALLDLVQITQHVIAGSEGDDALLGTPDGDIISSGGGHNIVRTHSGNDTVYTGPRNDIIHTGDGDDLIFAGSGDDSIVAGAGNDVIHGGAGDDTIDAGDGDDAIFGEDGDDTIGAGHGDDIVVAGDGDDSVSLDDGNDSAEGGAGNDEISGGFGDDYIGGGDGNDDLWGGTEATHTLSTASTAVPCEQAPAPEQDHAGLASVEHAHVGKDEVVDDHSTDRGADLIEAEAPSPEAQQVRDAQQQTAVADEAENTDASVFESGVSFEPHSETHASPNTNIDCQLETASAPITDDGTDRLTGGKGDDRVHGGSGSDVVVATFEDGDDVYDGGCGSDTYDLSQTNTSAVVDLLTGTAYSAETGTDVLIEIENVIGSSQNDTFIADEHQNTFVGGDGDDTFVYQSIEYSSPDDDERDVIRDFEVGDKIDVSKIDADSDSEGHQKYEFKGDRDHFEKSGELRYSHFDDERGSHTRVMGNNNDDLEEDFSFDMDGVLTLTYDDFIGVWHS